MLAQAKRQAEAIVSAAKTLQRISVVEPFSYKTTRQNQFIFFLKPEVFLLPEAAQRLAVTQMTLEKCHTYGVEVSGCMLLSGSYLEETAAMDRHYGFINRMSRKASTTLLPEEADAIRRAVGAPADTAICGGHEYMAAAGLSAQALDDSWQKKPATKVKSGLYVQLTQGPKGSGQVILVNGFHPSQLHHFTAQDRTIGVMLLQSDMPWSFLRNYLIGDTFPGKAQPGSLRRILHDEPKRYGFNAVDITNNCVHLSAGPFEALFEMHNFLGSVKQAQFDGQATAIAQAMAKEDLSSHMQTAQQNPTCQMGSLFDLTEGLDTHSAVALYKTIFAAKG